MGLGIILIGAPGTGKSIMNEIDFGLFGKANVFVDSGHIHASQYRLPLGNKQVLIVEEMATEGKWEISNSLKTMLTEEKFDAEQKFIRSQKVRSPRGISIWTNRATPVVIDPGDRRYAVFRTNSSPREEAAYIALWNEGLKQIPAFKRMLLDRDISNWSPYRPPLLTQAKQEIIEDSRTPVAREIQMLLDSGRLPNDLVQVADLHRLLNPQIPFAVPRIDLSKIIKALHELGCRRLEEKTKVRGKGMHLWAIRNVEHWLKASHADRVRQYELGLMRHAASLETPRVALPDASGVIDLQVEAEATPERIN